MPGEPVGVHLNHVGLAVEDEDLKVRRRSWNRTDALFDQVARGCLRVGPLALHREPAVPCPRFFHLADVLKWSDGGLSEEYETVAAVIGLENPCSGQRRVAKFVEIGARPQCRYDAHAAVLCHCFHAQFVTCPRKQFASIMKNPPVDLFAERPWMPEASQPLVAGDEEELAPPAEGEHGERVPGRRILRQLREPTGFAFAVSRLDH